MSLISTEYFSHITPKPYYKPIRDPRGHIVKHVSAFKITQDKCKALLRSPTDPTGKSISPLAKATSPKTEAIRDEHQQPGSGRRMNRARPLRKWHSYPRLAPSRKIDNINIVLDAPRRPLQLEEDPNSPAINNADNLQCPAASTSACAAPSLLNLGFEGDSAIESMDADWSYEERIGRGDCSDSDSDETTAAARPVKAEAGLACPWAESTTLQLPEQRREYRRKCKCWLWKAPAGISPIERKRNLIWGSCI